MSALTSAGEQQPLHSTVLRQPHVVLHEEFRQQSRQTRYPKPQLPRPVQETQYPLL
jgi:hypothetical protein